MPLFSKESFTKLSTCHPDLQALFCNVIKYFDCSIIEAYRSQEDQEKAYAEGNSKLQWPNSKHNRKPSMAVDVAPYPIDFDNVKRFYWFAGFVMAIAQKLKEEGKMTHAVRFGGDWDGDKNIDDETFRDLVHFELIE